jgi:serine/threonine protein kinase
VITYQMLSGQLPYGLQVTRLRTPDELKRLRYIELRSLRPDLPPWLDAVLRRALQAQPGKRQEALSEFVQDLRRPGPQYQRQGASPLIERQPLRFWQGLTLLLALAVLVLLWLRVTGA